MTKVHRTLMLGVTIVVAVLFITTAYSHSGRNSISHSQQHEPKSSGQIKIVAAENFYGEAAKAVGGTHVKVISIINNPSVDPHEFQPTIQTAKDVSDAQVVIYNGLGYDNWIQKLISATSKRQTVIKVGENVMGQQDGVNEHVWYMPKTMPRLATTLANKLAKIDPKHARDYHQNATAFRRSLQPFLHMTQQLKLAKSKQVEVTEPAFDYMLNALNYRLNNSRFPLAIEEGTDPRPKDMIQMQNDLRNHRVAFLVDNIQVKSPVVSRLVRIAKENHVPIVKVTESMPRGKDYTKWMMDQLNQIRKITRSNK